MEPGKRTVIPCFEYRAAHEPQSLWALRPKDDENITAGFEKITYQTCMNGVNHAVQWLERVLPSTGSELFDAFAYQGPSDLRVVFLCLAAAKLGKQIVFPSRIASANAQRHVVQTAGCVAIVHAKETELLFDPTEIGIEAIVVPELSQWLRSFPSKNSTPDTKTWEDAKDDPWITLHTSGTTGLPKVVCYTQQMMTQFDARPPIEGGPSPDIYIARGPWYTPIPLTHMVGIVIALQCAPMHGWPCILMPQASPQQMIAMINQIEPYGLNMPPSYVESLTISDGGWDALKKIKCIVFCGAPLRKPVGDKLVQSGIKVIPGLGSTEAGAYSPVYRFDDEWDWITFPAVAGATFERYPGNDGVYELVFRRTPGLERYQQVFLAFPELDTFRTNDLFYKHPTLSNTWKVAGRADDFFKLSSGWGIFALPVEQSIVEKAWHLVYAAVVAGAGHELPCLLVAPRMSIPANKLVFDLYPFVEEVNRSLGDLGRIRQDRIIVADPARPFKTGAKGILLRRETLIEYKDDIQALQERQAE